MEHWVRITTRRKELGWNDIDIFFDKQFLKATFVALILAVVGVGGSFPIILANVPPAASILTTLISSGVFAMVNEPWWQHRGWVQAR